MLVIAVEVLIDTYANALSILANVRFHRRPRRWKTDLHETQPMNRVRFAYDLVVSGHSLPRPVSFGFSG